jgi:hypothetical protein
MLYFVECIRLPFHDELFYVICLRVVLYSLQIQQLQDRSENSYHLLLMFRVLSHNQVNQGLLFDIIQVKFVLVFLHHAKYYNQH